MPRGLHNWTFKQVVKFLKSNNFIQSHVIGSHFHYIKSENGKIFSVQVPFHGNKAIRPRTLQTIILQSGIPKTSWLSKR